MSGLTLFVRTLATAFGVQFCKDWSKCIGGGWGYCFWNEDHVCSVKSIEGSCLIMESSKEREDGVFDFVPIFSKENRAKSIWSRASVCVHGEKGLMNFLLGERISKIT